MARTYKLFSNGERFPDHKSAQAQVVTVDGVKGLVSYTTLVARLDTDGWLSFTGLYSNTTRRHIGWFLKDYCKNADGICPSFATAKLCVEDHMRYNIHTGEVQPL